MRCAEVRKLLEQIGVRLKPVGRNLPLGDEGQAMRYDVVGQNATVRIPGGFRGVVSHHVRQELLRVDRGDGFFPGVISSVAQHMNELIEEALPVVNRLGSMYSSLVSSVLKKLATVGWPSRSVWMSCHRGVRFDQGALIALRVLVRLIMGLGYVGLVEWVRQQLQIRNTLQAEVADMVASRSRG